MVCGSRAYQRAGGNPAGSWSPSPQAQPAPLGIRRSKTFWKGHGESSAMAFSFSLFASNTVYFSHTPVPLQITQKEDGIGRASKISKFLGSKLFALKPEISSFFLELEDRLYQPTPSLIIQPAEGSGCIILPPFFHGFLPSRETTKGGSVGR